MNLSVEETAKLQQITENILKFSSEQTGIGSGITTAYEEVLSKLRYSTAMFYKAVRADILTVHHINALEGDIRMTLVASKSGMLSSFKSPGVGYEEIEEILAFLDILRQRISLEKQ